MKKQRRGRVRTGNPAKWHKPVPTAARTPNGLSGLFGRPTLRVADTTDRTARTAWPTAQAVSAPTSREDRQSLLILLAPFLIVAFSLASQQALRTLPPLRMPEIGMPEIAMPSRRIEAPALPAARPETSIADARPAIRSRVRMQSGAPVVPEAHPEIVAEWRPSKTWPLPAAADTPLPQMPAIAMPPLPATAAPSLPKLASLDTSLRPDQARPLPPVPHPVAPAAPTTCSAPLADPGGPISSQTRSPVAPGAFGRALAAAAQAQLGDLVIYNARYTRIGYPMGDVAALYGVCTDVVVRAYRALGIDLQELIYATRSGRGDKHIDHRRVDIIKRFFERHGGSLAISEFAEDYQPGDIVTYYRPQNRTSTQHIGVVGNQLAPSGRLMLIHNRGWGPQLEDALFVDKITGHYRFSGLDTTPAPASGTSASLAAPRIRTPWHVAGMSRRPGPSMVAAAPAALQGWRQARRELCLPQPRDEADHHTRAATRGGRKPKPDPVRTAAAVINR